MKNNSDNSVVFVMLISFFIGGFFGIRIGGTFSPEDKEKVVKEYIQHPERFGVQILYVNDVPRDTIVTYLK